MKKLLAFLFLSSATLHAEEAFDAPKYVSEAPLPKGWPEPGPYDKVSEKTYPKYRAAYTKGGGSFSFWRLFGHIKKKDIPMTAPVEMAIETKDDDLKKTTMGFLYQNTEVGATGADGGKIDVKDIGKSKVLSYTWMGSDSDAEIAKAKVALDDVLEEKKLKAESFRLLGYNGPGTPKKKRTYELQAVLPTS